MGIGLILARWAAAMGHQPGIPGTAGDDIAARHLLECGIIRGWDAPDDARRCEIGPAGDG